MNKVTYTEGQSLLLQVVAPVSTERIPLRACYGRVLAQDVRAAENVPPFDRSPYDGYAFRAQDTAGASAECPVTLAITEEIAAGQVPSIPVTAGKAAKVLTGAPVPDGADAVIMFEKTRFTADTVTIFAPVKPGSNIVRVGEDVRQGALLASRGQLIDPGLAGTLASQNIAAPLVYRQPVVGLLSTGSELTEPGEERAAGGIYDSNRFTLGAVLQRLGCNVRSYGIVRDDTQAIAAAMAQALQKCDAVVCSGGVSVGDYDLTPAAMEQIGVSILFRGADIKPGMACAYGVWQGKPVCAVSGNPASSVTNLVMIAMPMLKKLCGRADHLHRPVTVTLAQGFGKKSPVTRILRGRLDLTDGRVLMQLPQDQGNVVLSNTIGCDVMAIVPAGSGPLVDGTTLKGILL